MSSSYIFDKKCETRLNIIGTDIDAASLIDKFKYK